MNDRIEKVKEFLRLVDCLKTLTARIAGRPIVLASLSLVLCSFGGRGVSGGAQSPIRLE
jgi:hypothetical protein